MVWVTLLLISVPTNAQSVKALHDLTNIEVRKENWCSDYDRDTYPYPRTVEVDIIKSQGGMFSPYDMTCFSSRRESDVEHIVAIAEAHRSGMCSQSNRKRAKFSSDILNLTLATPHLNRNEKVAKDAAQWLPTHNECWFASRVVAVKKKYQLSVDKAEKKALKRVLENCNATNLRKPRCR